MNINDRKVQYVIIGAIVGCVLIFLILQFMISPALNSWKEDSAKAKEIRQKTAEMRVLVQSRPVIQLQIDAAKTAIKKMEGNIPLPVLGSYLLGMEEHIRACVGNLGVTVTTIADNDVLEISPGNSRFKIYRVRVQAKAGFNEYVKLVANIHNGNPLCSISGLNVVARENSPSVHEINFLVAWLVWSDPAKRSAFLIEGKK